MRPLIVIAGLALMCALPAAAEEQPGLKAGVQAPDFTAKIYTGEEVTLSRVITQGPVVLIFYRGGWCPYCNRHLHALQERLGEFEDLGAQIIAVSVDRPEKAAAMVEDQQLGFTVISDPKADLLEAYNLMFRVPDDLAKKYKEEYHIDLEGASGRSDHVIAVPAAYVIDRSGTILYAYANRDYKVRASPDELIKVLKDLEQ